MVSIESRRLLPIGSLYGLVLLIGSSLIGFLLLAGETKTGMLFAFLPSLLLISFVTQHATLFFALSFPAYVSGLVFPIQEAHISFGDIVLLFAYTVQILKGHSYVPEQSKNMLLRTVRICAVTILIGSIVNVIRLPQYSTIILANTIVLLIRGYSIFFIAGELKHGVKYYQILVLLFAVTVVYLLGQFFLLLSNHVSLGLITINPNLVSSLTDILFPFFLLLPFMTDLPRSVKATGLLMVVATVVFYIIGAVRGSLVAALFVAAPFLIIKASRWQLYSLLGMGIVLITVFHKTVYSAIQSFFSREVSLFIRLLLWKAAALIVQDKPLFGLGLDIFRLQKYGYMFPGWLDPENVKSSHNLFLEMIVSFGLVGFAAIMIFVFVLLGTLLQMYRRASDKSYRYFFAASFSAVSMTLIHGLIDSFLFFHLWMVFLFTITGMVLAYSDPKQQYSMNCQV